MTNYGRDGEYRDQKKPDWTILHNKLPPTQRVGLVCRVAADRFGDRRLPLQQGISPSSHSSFCEEVFSRCVVAGIVDPGWPRSPIAATARMRWTGQIFWLLAL